MFRFKRKPRVQLDGWLSATGSDGSVLLVTDDDALILSDDPYGPSDGLDRLSDVFFASGRFPDVLPAALGHRLADDETELVPVRVTIERI